MAFIRLYRRGNLFKSTQLRLLKWTRTESAFMNASYVWARRRKRNGWTSCSAFHERRGKSKRSVFPWNVEKLHINLEIIRKIFPTSRPFRSNFSNSKLGRGNNRSVISMIGSVLNYTNICIRDLSMNDFCNLLIWIFKMDKGIKNRLIWMIIVLCSFAVKKEW